MSQQFRVATPADVPGLARTMAAAFETDPVWGAYSFPDDDRRRAQLEAFWAPQLLAAMRFAWTLVTPGCEAGAVWIPPGEVELTSEQEREVVELTSELVGPQQATVIFDVFAALDAAHPHDPPHFYLSLLGTHTDHRGSGLGMGLVASSLGRIDELGMPAYLESTNPANDARYARHGFEPVGVVELENGRRITTMWRPAGQGGPII